MSTKVAANLLYSKEHEWVEKVSGMRVRIGITDFAQHQLGDIVFVELPAVGDEIQAHESMGTIESVKAVSDLYAPVSGSVVEVNAELEDGPEIINTDPYQSGWMIVVELHQADELAALLNTEQYEAFIAEEA
ncbi:glycine cleavage system protein GcvH [Aneurinibacillus sp. REN35]|uniref:glycine cleavage system protein GcvH n=1 Tax=Aneurinibacillus sp. REN35 TaxID=3237286 RepID=UPI0035284202